MKWFTWLFSFYILALSGVPCTAPEDCCMDELKTTTTAYTEKHTDDADHNPACLCSPFFACGACHGIIIANMHIEIAKAPVTCAGVNFFYIEQSLLDFPPYIWQPPKTA